jgi:3-methyladenine DNA glycosylase Mpg
MDPPYRGTADPADTAMREQSRRSMFFSNARVLMTWWLEGIPFWLQVGAFPDGMTALQCLTRPLEAVHYFLEHDSLAPAFAKYVYDVFFMFPLRL